MKNNQDSIKNTIKKYFLKGDSDISFKSNSIEEPEVPKKSPMVYRKADISKDVTHPGLARAMKALQLSNPFKGV